MITIKKYILRLKFQSQDDNFGIKIEIKI